MLVTPDGFPLMGEKGPIQVNHNNYIIKTNGEASINQAVGNTPKNFTSKDVNQSETRYS